MALILFTENPAPAQSGGMDGCSGSMRLSRPQQDSQAFSQPPANVVDGASFQVRPRLNGPSPEGATMAPGGQAPLNGSLDQLVGSLLHGQTADSSWANALVGGARQLRAKLFDSPAHNVMQLSTADRRDLANSDLAIIIDHSGSMKTRDCPGVSLPGGLASRFEWSIDELSIFANGIMSSLPHGFSLITFDTNPEAFQISSVDSLQQVLTHLRPGGGTRLEAALQTAFQLHRAHLNQPLLIAVITDGEVNVRESQATMIEGTREFPLPNGVAITVLQIGLIAEQTTAPRLRALGNLRYAGAAYEPLTEVPFSRVRRDGLANDVLAALHTNLMAPGSMYGR
jgi:hypothetical protein